MNRIRELRQRMNMTQSEFAELCDVSTVSISRYESGWNMGSIAAQKVAQACHVSIDYVLDKPRTEADQAIVLSDREYTMITNYRKLSDCAQSLIEMIVKGMTEISSSK